MAKKATTTHPAHHEPSAPAHTAEPVVKMSDAIREGLGELGIDAGIADLESFFKAKYPGFQYNKNSLSSTLSTIRTKLKGEGGAVPAAPRAKAAKVQAVSNEPSGADLMRVKALADNRGGIEELLSQVQTIYDLAEEVGGIPKLLKCLEMLHTLILK